MPSSELIIFWTCSCDSGRFTSMALPALGKIARWKCSNKFFSLLAGISSRQYTSQDLNAKELVRTLEDSQAASREVLTDTFGRKHNYLRISLTERCNLRCKSQY